MSPFPPIEDRPPLERLIAVLAAHTPLAGEERSALAQLPHELRTVAKGESFLEARRTHQQCYVLSSAFAHKEKHSTDARRVVAINLPGDVVNVESVLALESDYSATAIRSGEIAAIPAAALRELVFRFPAIGLALWLRSQAEAAVYREWLLNDERRDLGSRIAHLLCETAARLRGLGAGGDGTPVVPLAPDEVARAIGSIALYVEAALKRLEAEGLVSIAADSIVLRDPAGLVERGRFDPRYLVDGAPGFASAPGRP